jgi:Domain of unknown function (DUF4331)
MRRVAYALVPALLIAIASAVAFWGGPGEGRASSHREAPLISEDPVADNTDVYAFVSPDRPDTVTIVANYVPLEEPAGGPNFNKFGDDVLYALNVDNTGDGEEDISYQFRFKTTTGNENTFLYNTGPIDTLSDPDWNVRQTYTVTRVTTGQSGNLGWQRSNRTKRGKRTLWGTRSQVLGRGLATPPVNIGPRSTPHYEALAAAAVNNLSGGIKVFAGQRDDPFYVDLGPVFDLAGLRPFNSLHAISLPAAKGVDGVGGFNTHTIAIQVPMEQLKGPKGQMTIGVYASALRQRVRVFRGDKISSYGPWVQVSRLGEPLINEAVIPIGLKDEWNASDPSDDSRFTRFYREPEVTRLENALYAALDNANETNRDDLVAILLTGVPGLNFTGNTKADLLRLNMGIAPTAPVGKGKRLGVLEGDLAGFPNGRRLEDDVVDIELRALAEGYGPILNSLLGLPNRSPNNLLGDGVDANDFPFRVDFPYLPSPHQGYEHVHHSVVGGP